MLAVMALMELPTEAALFRRWRAIPQYLADQLRRFASGDRQNALMQPIAKALKDDEISAVSQILRECSCHSLPSRPVPAQLRDRGKQVAEVGDSSVRVQACESCHGPHGEGEPSCSSVLGWAIQSLHQRSNSNVSSRHRKSQQMHVPPMT